MMEAIGIVESGQIKFPAAIHLPEGQTVRVAWDENLPPLEDEEWTEEDVKIEIKAALRRTSKV